MPKCRITGYNHYNDGEPLEQGDVIELTEAQYEQWSYQFERLDDDSDEDSSDDAESDSGNDSDEVHDGDEESPDDDLSELVEQSVSDMRNLLETGEYDDRLDELYELEVANNDRTTAKEAIDERRED